METGVLVISIILLAIAMLFLFFRKPKHNTLQLLEVNRLQAENGELKVKAARAEEKVDYLLQEREKLIIELGKEREKAIEAILSLERSDANFIAQQEKLSEQKQELNSVQEKFNKDFELIANKILEEKTQKFTETNRTNLDILLHPLKENIKAFEDKVEKVYKAESDERNVLKGEISKLMELNKQISEEAHNLTKALKADTKKQGNWGEVILDRILQASGLIEGESYTKQSGYVQEEGNRMQPDVVVTLPDNKHVVIDSKVSLIAYERLVNCEIDEDRKSHLKTHLLSIRNHITGLGAKNYQDLYQINSPDFVLLFVPIESSFAIAVQNDIDLFEFAWSKRVVIVTPSTLLATLRTVASIWKHEQQTKNAIEIATRAGTLYDKFVGFVTDLKRIGDNLDKAKENYNDAFSKLSNGSGNLIGRVETLKKLGAKTSKQLDERLISEE